MEQLDLKTHDRDLTWTKVYIQIAGRGTKGTYNIKGGLTASVNRLGKYIEVQTSRPTDWKYELKDIQAARVEREVARFQRTIDETQRQWEANYACHAPRGPTNIQSDSSAEVLHNPRNSAYLVPPRHDLRRTVSVDTISAPPKERLLLGPLQKHTSVDNLRQTKVSNLMSLGLADQHQMSSMSTVSSISSINLNSMNRMSSYEQNSRSGKSVDSISGYSDRESHGDGDESDLSGRTQDEYPLWPSVKRLSSKFDPASQERVNDSDKHEADGNRTFNGKKNISLMEKSPGEQPYNRNYTNNLKLNKRIEKPYTMKEVRSSPDHSSDSPRNTITTSDHDDSEFDDPATVTCISLPPTPHSHSDRVSQSVSSLVDGDSCISSEYRNSSNLSSSDEPVKTIFGVTLRKANSRGSHSRSSISSTSSLVCDSNGRLSPLLSVSSLADLDNTASPKSTGNDSSFFISKENARPEYQSVTDLSFRSPSSLISQKHHSSTLDLTPEIQAYQNSAQVNSCPEKAINFSSPVSRRESRPESSEQTHPSFTFVQKGKRRSMSDILKNYRTQLSQHEISRIDEKGEVDSEKRKNKDTVQKISHLETKSEGNETSLVKSVSAPPHVNFSSNGNSWIIYGAYT